MVEVSVANLSWRRALASAELRPENLVFDGGMSARPAAGVRSGALTMKSRATSQDSTTVVLSTTNSNLVMVQDTDPNTGLPWTPAAINALDAGPKVAASEKDMSNTTTWKAQNLIVEV